MSPARIAILALVALTSTSCESGSALQLVSAHVSSAEPTFVPAGVGAWAGSEIVGWAPLAPDGSCLLAVPVADRIEFAITDAAGAPAASIESQLGVPVALRVCRPSSDPYVLGEVRLAPAPCRPPPDCREAWDELRACRDPNDVTCPECPPDDCGPLRRIFEACLDGRELECPGSPEAWVRLGRQDLEVGCEGTP